MLFTVGQAGAQGGLQSSPTPGWVVEHEPDFSAASSDDAVTNGQEILLLDHQVNAAGDVHQEYSRQVVRVHTLAATQSQSVLNLAYYSQFQTYSVNRLVVWRDGEAHSLIGTERVKVRQQRSEGVTGIAEITVLSMFLGDIRRGDVIDFAVTVEGIRPDFLGRLFGTLALGGLLPIRQNYKRLSVPRDVGLTIKYSGGHPEARITEHDEIVEYLWDTGSTPALEFEWNAPIWYPQVATVEFTDFDGWADVVAWGSIHFSIPENMDKGVVAQAKALLKRGDDGAIAARKILHFMQSEVRYVGEFLGRSGYTPFTPQEVLARRYGDCKDQTMLMLALLSAVGIEAWPALVSQSWGRNVESRIPSPSAFDHSIIYASIDGKDYWLDPTITIEPENVAVLGGVEFERALILKEGESKLAAIPNHLAADGSYSQDINYFFDLARGPRASAYLSLDIVYRGPGAGLLRLLLASGQRETLAKTMRKELEKKFKDIEERQPIDIMDNYADGSILVRGEYLLPNPWKSGKEEGRWDFGYRANNIRNILRVVAALDRKTPMALKYPSRIRETMVYTVPPDWDQAPVNEEISNPYFKFTRKIHYKSGAVRAVFEYETLSDHVPVEALEKFNEDHRKARENLYFFIYVRMSKKETIDTSSLDVESEEPQVPEFALELDFPKIEFLGIEEDEND
jgi:transglutaminase-like putative cysteine protease